MFGDFMKKEKFHILMKTNSSNDEYNLLGEYDREKRKIEFYESNNLRSKIGIDINNHILAKDNIDYKITLDLDITKETNGEVYLKKEEKTLNLTLKTNKFELKNNKLSMSYIILEGNEEIIYEIEMGD